MPVTMITGMPGGRSARGTPALLASGVAVGLALLAVICSSPPSHPDPATGPATLATAVTVSGAAFVAMGFLSQAAKYGQPPSEAGHQP